LRLGALTADRWPTRQSWSTIVLLIRDHREHGIDGRELEGFVRAIGAALRDRSLEDPTGDARVVRELAGDGQGVPHAACRCGRGSDGARGRLCASFRPFLAGHDTAGRPRTHGIVLWRRRRDVRALG
jgi:hypothetical protein